MHFRLSRGTGAVGMQGGDADKEGWPKSFLSCPRDNELPDMK